MFRKLATATVLASGLLLSNCMTVSPTQVSSITTSFISAVDKAVAVGCAAVPEVSAIITLVNSGIGTSVAGVASAFCAAFSAAVPTKASHKAPVMARRFGRRFGAAGPIYACAGNICGWKL